MIRRHLYAVLAYALLAVVYSWPLLLSLSSRLTGPPGGDTGIYIWNQWVFHHEIFDHGRMPFFTCDILAVTGCISLGLHNYTVLANLFALPLIGPFGIVTAFNLTYLLMGVLSAYAMFLLVKEVVPDADAEAWLAGAFFGWSPMLVTRSFGHFSLVAAAPLALFTLLLVRLERHWRGRDAAGLGVMLALAGWSDVYYAVYAVLIAASFILLRALHAARRPAEERPRGRGIRIVDGLILVLAIFSIATAATGGWDFVLFGQLVRARSLHTPVLVLTVLAVGRTLTFFRIGINPIDRGALMRAIRLGAIAVVVASILLSPWLYAVAVLIGEGQFVSPAIYWRSSPPGVDLLSFFVPNPNHPLAPAAFYKWLDHPMQALEHVASIPLVMLAVGIAAWRGGWRPPGIWAGLTAIFVLIAAGPFLQVAGTSTYVPGPWAFLRYVPIVGLARTPTRFAVVVMLMVGVLFALALRAVRLRHGRALGAGVGALLLFELLPAPRNLGFGDVPALFSTVAADPRKDVRVLDLPFGISSGTATTGKYSSLSQFHQTHHEKPIVGGGLSRVSEARVAAIRSHPILDALIQLAEGKPLTDEQIARSDASAAAFVRDSRVAWVVVDRAETSPEMRAFAVRVLRLEPVASAPRYELFRPTAAAPAGEDAAPR
jgi:hypothetical protein